MVWGHGWHGPLADTVPWLTLADNGALQLHSGNSSIGRGRWSTMLTIAFRGGDYRVAGVTHSWYDTLELSGSECDVNLLTGRGG